MLLFVFRDANAELSEPPDNAQGTVYGRNKIERPLAGYSSAEVKKKGERRARRRFLNTCDIKIRT